MLYNFSKSKKNTIEDDIMVINIDKRSGDEPIDEHSGSDDERSIDEHSGSDDDEPSDSDSFEWKFLQKICSAPSPIGLEAAMTYHVIEPYFKKFKPTNWLIHKFKGSASIVLEKPAISDKYISCMIIGHADKVRMQVRSVDNKGRIFIDSDSFVPQGLIGNKVTIYSTKKSKMVKYKGSVQSLPPIHYIDSE
jgi:hypothetical protein